METQATKVCKKCYSSLPLSHFSKVKLNKGGLSHTCNRCISDYHRIKRATKKEKESQYEFHINPNYLNSTIHINDSHIRVDYDLDVESVEKLKQFGFDFLFD